MAQRKLLMRISLLTLACACMPPSACYYRCTPYCNTWRYLSNTLTLHESASSGNLNFRCVPTLLFGRVIADKKMFSFLPKFFTEAVILGWKVKGAAHQTAG